MGMLMGIGHFLACERGSGVCDRGRLCAPAIQKAATFHVAFSRPAIRLISLLPPEVLCTPAFRVESGTEEIAFMLPRNNNRLAAGDNLIMAPVAAMVLA